MDIKTTLLPCLIYGLLFISCNPCDSRYQYQIPEDINDGLSTGKPAQAGMDSAYISEAVRRIKCGDYGEVHSLLIYKNNQLVVEEYFGGHKYQWDAPYYHGEAIQWNRDMLHHMMSTTKSFTSACIGIAIKEGFIQSAHQSIFDYLPDHQQFRKNGKENITIEHLLTMTSGLEWNEWGSAHGTPANDIDRIYFECSDDPLKCVLERELVAKPGEEFTYNGGGIIALGEIIKNASGMTMGEFSEKYLFKPLGIDSTYWYRFDNGTYATDGSLYLTPRNMMKLGVTYLHQGMWDGRQIIPEDWVRMSSETYRNNSRINLPIEDSGRNGYGYTWWTSEFRHKGRTINMFRANGWGGQTIMVFPQLEMAVVFTGGNYATNSSLFKIIRRYILPAIA